MKIFTRKDVYTASIERIERIVSSFDNIIVSYSGGKDSVVVFQLVLEVARKQNKLPINVLFIDQETEYEATIDIVDEIMRMPEVTPHWLQIPFKLYNATNKAEEWFHPWDENKKEDWVREKSDISIHENTLKTDRFGNLFTAYIKQNFPDSTANFGGVRAEESPARHLSLTTRPKWEDITWGKCVDKKTEKYTFYPVYDWSYSDVWKYIHSNGFKYNEIYDLQYQHGVKLQSMRVSSLIHETALKSLEYLKEVEPDNWNKIVKRVEGVNTQKKVGNDLKCPKELPYMFNSWGEYRDYLLDKLFVNEKNKEIFTKEFAKKDSIYGHDSGYHRTCIESIIKSDFTKSKLMNYYMRVHWTKEDEKAI